MGHDVIKRVSRGMLKGVAAWVVVFGAATSYGNVTWHSDNTTTFLLVSKHSGCTVIIR